MRPGIIKRGVRGVMGLMLGTVLAAGVSAEARACNIDIATFFKEHQGCFLLYNLTKNTYDMTYGGDFCDTRRSPASTFKIANSLIALDLGILKDEHTTYRWDGTKQFLPSWEHDQTLASAVKDSVVWYFQAVAKQVGTQQYQAYLKRFSYGNQDILGGLTTFWLGRSLTISPKEQIAFLKALYSNTLPVSKHAINTVKKILILESSARGTLSGKTGAASVDGFNIGWFVGHLASGDTEYLFATNVTAKGTDYKINDAYAGLAAKAITKDILSCQALF